MNALATSDEDVRICEKICVTTSELGILLSLGRHSAVDIGIRAGARVYLGNRRILWNIRKVKEYVDSISA